MNAIAIFLERKPDLIFIDLTKSKQDNGASSTIPEINGYELCSQLRQFSHFQDVPIIVFCENVSLVERVKAKMVGCSELFNQAIETQSIIDATKRHLTPSTTTNPAN